MDVSTSMSGYDAHTFLEVTIFVIVGNYFDFLMNSVTQPLTL
jgi:hypothetical protein